MIDFDYQSNFSFLRLILLGYIFFLLLDSVSWNILFSLLSGIITICYLILLFLWFCHEGNIDLMKWTVKYLLFCKFLMMYGISIIFFLKFERIQHSFSDNYLLSTSDCWIYRNVIPFISDIGNKCLPIFLVIKLKVYWSYWSLKGKYFGLYFFFQVPFY